MQTKIQFRGKGGELFLKLLAGGFLSAITLGIYVPWFVANLNRYLYSKVTLRGRDFDVLPRFAGKGWEMFKIGLLGAFLSSLTLGNYLPWFIARSMRYWAENTEGVSESAHNYRLGFGLTGGKLFGNLFVSGLLSGLTLGIYMPWAMCKLVKLVAENLWIKDSESGDQVGSFAFEGTGGSLFGMVLLNGLLCSVTLGIYGPWAVVKTLRFWASNSRLSFGEEQASFDFEGKGGTLFGRLLLNGLLCGITLGIYSYWAVVDILRFLLDNTVVGSQGAAEQPALAERPAAAQLPAPEAIEAVNNAREQARVR